MSLLDALLPIIKLLLPLLNSGFVKNLALRKVNKAISSKIGKDVAKIKDYYFKGSNGIPWLKFRLKGDHEDINIWLDCYEIDQVKPLKIVIKEIRSDRAWVEGILKQFVEGKTHEINDPNLQKILCKLLQ